VLPEREPLERALLEREAAEREPLAPELLERVPLARVPLEREPLLRELAERLEPDEPPDERREPELPDDELDLEPPLLACGTSPPLHGQRCNADTTRHRALMGTGRTRTLERETLEC
jgi:hypothetical protein